MIQKIGPWEDHPKLGERTNFLLRECYLIADECSRIVNDEDITDPDVLEEFRDLMMQSADAEVKYARTRGPEVTEFRRRWLG